jgi:hypothetical protein
MERTSFAKDRKAERPDGTKRCASRRARVVLLAAFAAFVALLALDVAGIDLFGGGAHDTGLDNKARLFDRRASAAAFPERFGCFANRSAPARAGRPGRRALVLYMLTSKLEYQAQQEWDNFAFFLRHGVLERGAATALFDGADYVFYQQSKFITAPQLCGRHENVWTALVPMGPCDLCQHAAVVRLLDEQLTGRLNASHFDADIVALAAAKKVGDDARAHLFGWQKKARRQADMRRQEAERAAVPIFGGAFTERYSQIVMLNSGVRGPFISNARGASWLDVVASGGGGGGAWAPDTVTAAMASFELRAHPQSYFLSVPGPALRLVMDLFEATCYHDKGWCIENGETAVAELCFNHSLKVHSMGQNMTWASFHDVAADAERTGGFEKMPVLAGQTLGNSYMAWAKKFGHWNPTREWSNPCDALFVKFGGIVWAIELIRPSLVRAVRGLSLRQAPPARVLADPFLGLQAHDRCRWFGEDQRWTMGETDLEHVKRLDKRLAEKGF